MPPAEARLTSDSDLESVISYQDAAPRTLKRPRRESGPKYKCSAACCDAVFKRLDHLDRHEYQQHTRIKRHACTYDGCDKVYSILTHLKRHVRVSHERTASSSPKNVKCTRDGCDKLFRSACNMQRHIREVHENPKVYRCSHCGEKFTQKLKMRRHEINAHTGAFPHRCDRCGKGFYQQWQYERHYSAGDCKVYRCPQCEEQFDKWSLYRKHCRETLHGRQYFKCAECAVTYPKPGELQQHMALKHNTNGDVMAALEYKCTQTGCERSYTYERNLRQHMRTAHKGQRFECTATDCGLDFSSAQNLSKHVQRQHSGEVKRKQKRDAKKRKQRRDAGRPIVSHLVTLAGIAVTKPLDALLRERDDDALDVVSTALAKEVGKQIISAAESDMDEQPKASDAGEFDQLLAIALTDDN